MNDGTQSTVVQLSLIDGMERTSEPAAGPFYCTHPVVGAAAIASKGKR